MTAANCLELWSNRKEEILEPDPVSVRLRSASARKIEELQMKYGINRSQMLNDIIALGLLQLYTD